MKDFHSVLCLLLFFSGLMVAFSTNPVESVLFLILAFFNAGAILISFNAEFLGLIFIIVYVGAIAVLFLFVIMMLNVKVHENIFQRLFVENKSRFAFFAFLFYLAVTILYTFLKSVVGTKEYFVNFGFNIFSFVDSLNNIDVLGQVLYNYYLVAFLLAGLILLVALIGAIVLTLRFNNAHKSQLVSRQLARRDNFLSFFS
jgi:NADH-quinone oxidoreductase subunit J